MRPRAQRPWPTYLLAALCVGAIVAAVLIVGPASGTATSSGRTITVGEGVVQATVSGSGNIQAATQLDLGFKTSGVVTQIYVHQGQHVTEGQLLAELNPDSAEVTLEQARASLQASEASLVQEEETDGEGSSGSGSSVTGASHATASAASVQDVSYSPPTSPTTTAPTSTPPTTTTTTQTTSTPSTTAPTTITPNTTTAPARVAPSTTIPSHTEHAKAPSRKTSSESGAGADTGTGSSSTSGSRESDSGSTAAKATLSTAAREANIASARAAIKSDRLTVQSAEQSLSDTKLFAPTTGTIVSLSGEVGEAVSASGTTKASSSSSGSGSSGSGSSSAVSAFGASSAATGASGSGSSGSGSSSSSSFAVLSDLSSMQLVVALSESEVIDVRDGQPATVTIEALEGLKLAAHVVSVATLPTSSSGVVSYDVTFQLDQLASGLKPGMSATAEVVVKQAEGVNVPTSAITADTVTVVHDGTHTSRRVVTGLAGNSSTIVLSGLSAGEQIVLPVAPSTNGLSSVLSRLGSRTGALGGAAGGLGAGGAAALFGGGGGFRGG
jgi:multidrug efflux pump subunit AcrA (membrane-fusion protein)